MPSTTSNSQGTYRREPSQDEYRQVDYHDGNNNRIVEYRRRPRSVQPQADTPNARTHSSSKNVTKSSKSNSLSSSSTIPDYSVRPPVLTKAPRRALHVTSATPAKKPKARPEVVIIQDPSPGHPVRSSKKSALDNAPPTIPPSAPRITRLPTPDFEDDFEGGIEYSGNRRFCDCCVDSRVMKYCSSCRKGL